MTSIVLADDHHVVRQGLRVLLESEPGLTIIGEAADGLRAVELVERLKPDVLVADLMMPNLSGLEVTRQVVRRCPTTRVVLLSMHADEGYVAEGLRSGATGYVLKDSTADELVRAVHEAAAGRRYLSPPLSERALESYLSRSETATLDLFDTLTAREREVLHLAAEGMTSAEVSGRLFISPRTVEIHRAHLMRKLGLKNQTELVRYALRRGILPLDG
ncbi:MAG: response regulator transcription factor [Isosphaeraceae bacterium]